MRFLGSIGGQDPVVRLMFQVGYNSWAGNPPQPPPTALQVSYVLHALADHTSLLQAVEFTHSPSTAGNVGRWLHAYADTIECSESLREEHANDACDPPVPPEAAAGAGGDPDVREPPRRGGLDR